MSTKVYTYNHPKEWRQNTSFFNEIKQDIHIAATINLAEGIKECYQDIKQKEFENVFTIKFLMTEFYSYWHNPEIQLQQYLTLSKVIHDVIETNELKDSFKHNTPEILNTIRFLVFQGISPEDLNTSNLNKKEKTFKKVWTRVEQEDGTYGELRRTMKEPERLKDAKITVSRIVNDKKKNDDFKIESRKIILHGFYFITPEQQVFLKILEDAGFDIVFFQYYDYRFPETFNFIKAFINTKFGWSDSWEEKIKVEKHSSTLGARFLSDFEEKNIEIGFSDKKEIVAYESFYSFLNKVILKYYPIKTEDIIAHKDAQIIATNADILNELMVQYYPDKYADRRNFLNYPVGKFLLSIHEVFKKNRLIFTKKILMSTFSSGWLHDEDNKKNARDYTYQLKEILPFFEGCVFVEEWITRIDFLIKEYDDILSEFSIESNDRVAVSSSSPFSKISYLSLHIDEVKQIKKYFILLKKMSLILFEESDEISSISHHFDRLLNLVKQHAPKNEKIMLEEEVVIINKLENKFKKIEAQNLFLYDDLVVALEFYLSGRFEEKKDFFIKPFIEIDGETFKSLDKDYYVTGLDEMGLPLGEFQLPWPFKKETYEELSEAYPILEMNTLRNKSIKKISRYLLFNAFEFIPEKNLKLSWIRNFLNRIDLKPSVYIYQLDLIQREETNIENSFPLKQNKVVDDMTYSEMKFKKVIGSFNHEDVLAEYVQCPRRFYYSFVLKSYPTFSDDFMHQFLFSELIKLVKRYTQYENTIVIREVNELFPQWTNFKKLSIAKKSITYAGRNIEGKDQVNDFFISSTRKKFQFPGLNDNVRSSLYEKVRDKQTYIYQDLVKSLKERETIMEAKPGYHCRFCPHNDVCQDVKYPID